MPARAIPPWLTASRLPTASRQLSASRSTQKWRFEQTRASHRAAVLPARTSSATSRPQPELRPAVPKLHRSALVGNLSIQARQPCLSSAVDVRATIRISNVVSTSPLQFRSKQAVAGPVEQRTSQDGPSDQSAWRSRASIAKMLRLATECRLRPDWESCWTPVSIQLVSMFISPDIYVGVRNLECRIVACPSPPLRGGLGQATHWVGSAP
jgi:hypothetical protein